MIGLKVSWEVSVITNVSIAIKIGEAPTVGLTNGKNVIHATEKSTLITWFLTILYAYFLKTRMYKYRNAKTNSL